MLFSTLSVFLKNCLLLLWVLNAKLLYNSILQLYSTGTKDLICKDDFYDDFNMDDVDLTFENYEELFGASHSNAEQLFDDAGIDSFFELNEMSAVNSNCQGEFVVEVHVINFFKCFW